MLKLKVILLLILTPLPHSKRLPLNFHEGTLYITSPTAPNNHNIDQLSHAVPHMGKLDLEILHSFLCSNINHSKLIARVQIDQNMKGKYIIIVPLQYLKSPNPLQS